MQRTTHAVILAAVIAPACSDRPPPLDPALETVDDIRVTLQLEDEADRLIVNLEVRNLDSLPRSVRFPTCNPTIEVYDTTAAMTDPPAWDERRWREDAMACLPVGRNADLVPGGATGTRHEVADAAVLGDSLPPGIYRIVVVFTMSQPEAVLDFSAGNVRLRRP